MRNNKAIALRYSEAQNKTNHPFRILFLFSIILALLATLPANAAINFGKEGPKSVADLTENLIDAVVNISTTQHVEQSRRVPMPDLPPNTPFREFFEDFFDQGRPNNNDEGKQSSRKVTSLGSGFVIDPEGIIITNNHVIENADEIKISFNDGTELDATLVGRDPKTDIAVLKVTPDAPLKAVSFGDSDQSRVGDWALAIGNPFGLGGTVTIGIISALNRDIRSGPYDNFIQTDAAINRGNSGGPLFNMNGEVIGVNTAIFSRTGDSVGIGFSVPANTAKNVVNQLLEFGETRRGWLGVLIQPVTESIGQSLGLDNNQGAFVTQVTPDGPSDKGGIEAGDVILKFDGKDVPSSRVLPAMVARTEIGKKVDVVVLRKGKEKVLTITLGRLEDGEKLVADNSGDSTDNQGETHSDTSLKIEGLKLSLAEINDRYRAEFGLDETASGLVVTDLDNDSSAYSKGIRKGTIILEVAQEDVKTPEDVKQLVSKAIENNLEFILVKFQTGNNGQPRFDGIKIE